MLKKDGSPVESSVSGRISSIHYPETFEFFIESLDKLLNLWNIRGIIWDEPKTLGPDYSELAIKKLGTDASVEDHLNANVDFYSRVNGYIKDTFPGIDTSFFTYASGTDLEIQTLAKIKNLDYYGCDGRPWPAEAGGKLEGQGKVLLGNGERFIRAARAAGKKTLWLVENHNMDDADTKLIEKYLPGIMQKDIDQMIYYYYPRNLKSPEKVMEIIAKNIKSFK